MFFIVNLFTNEILVSYFESVSVICYFLNTSSILQQQTVARREEKGSETTRVQIGREVVVAAAAEDRKAGASAARSPIAINSARLRH
ncbi:hypothetical protein GWI33_017219 [Rhynchophorus ferrugineus]|uniref:Uncharacterized protein n=1 Tax=Rhynchophorus ferrugineus TaxID=354439 RepID=A0A834HWE2_RHYFE|nr:hypothetical protein GWI33_017219 [Rhynchophorus ferrugineus]